MDPVLVIVLGAVAVAGAAFVRGRRHRRSPVRARHGLAARRRLAALSGRAPLRTGTTAGGVQPCPGEFPGRQELQHRLGSSAPRPGGETAIVLVEIDATPGRTDDDVMAVARVIRADVGEEGTIHRYDAGVLCLTIEVADRRDATVMVDRLRAAIDSTVFAGRSAGRVTVGMAVTRTDLTRALRLADAALFQARTCGTGCSVAEMPLELPGPALGVGQTYEASGAPSTSKARRSTKHHHHDSPGS